MGLGDLTLLLVGRDSLAEQLHVHLEHRGADVERTEVSEALDTIAVAIPDLVILSKDASGAHAERIREGLLRAGNPPRLLVLCEKRDAARTGTYKHDFIGTLEPEIGAELIASSVESLCSLFEKPGSASRPLRSLIADVRRAQTPARRTTQLLVASPPAAASLPAPVAPAVKPMIAAPPPAALAAIAGPIAAPVAAPIAAPVAAPIAAPPSAAPVKPIVAAALPHAPTPAAVVEAQTEQDTDLVVEIRIPSIAPFEEEEVTASLPPPAMVAAILTAAQAPAPEVTTQAQAVEPKSGAPWSLGPSLLRLSRRQRMIAAAAILLCAIGIATIGSGDRQDKAIAPHASANINNAAHEASKPAAAVLVAAAAAPAPAPVKAEGARPEATVTAIEEGAVDDEALDESASEDGDDGAFDGERYDPHADPARARANFYVNAGHRLRKQGRLGMAEASYLKALQALPTYARAVSGLVEVHLTRRDGVEALRWAKKLIALQPKRGAHQRLLGDAYAVTGQKDQARSAWAQAVRLGDRVARSR